MVVEEIWKDVVGFEGLYMVSSLGRVKSLDRTIERLYNGKLRTKSIKERILKPHISKTTGYYYINLQSKAKSIHSTIHRLVSLAFIENPDCKKVVNHINGIKTDNRVENLEWVTTSENTFHAYKLGLRKASNKRGADFKGSIPISQFTIEGIWIKDWPGSMEAQRETGVFQANISKCLLGKRKITGGFIWKYKELI
jgi:hypothetical protein